MIPSFINQNTCTGCSACFAICPQNCITMEKDKEGFLFPNISEECVHCGLCKKVCPQIKLFSVESEKKKAYAALSKRKKIWENSSSGGAFVELCEAFGDENTYFAGAVWDGLEVKHIITKGVENVSKYCKSKYVQSNMNDVFLESKKILDGGNKLVFSGTPCQIAGLKSYINKEYNNLLTIEIICHGVGSQNVFLSCIEVLNNQYKNKIKEYSFREKKHIYIQDHIEKIVFENNKVLYIEKDPYIQLFMKQYCVRKSCGLNCKYRTKFRNADITIGDFKSIEKVFPDLNGSKKNFSTIIFNTTKGKKLIADLKNTMELHECLIEDIIQNNPVYCNQIDLPYSRDVFFKEYVENARNAINNWTEPAKKFQRSFQGKLYDLLPIKIRKKLR